MVAIHDGSPNDKLEKVISKYPNITWVISNINVGQLTALDQAFKYIDTDYYFKLEEDWQFIR